jgi:hypothetical protein
MKYTDIHNDLPEKELREYFSKEIAATNFNMYKVKKRIVPYDNGKEPFVWAIQNAEAELECKVTELEFLRKKRSLYVLMKDKGWFSHDVSDYITKNMEYECWMDFIGTEKEYEALMVVLEEERNNENTK